MPCTTELTAGISAESSTSLQTLKLKEYLPITQGPVHQDAAKHSGPIRDQKFTAKYR